MLEDKFNKKMKKINSKFLLFKRGFTLIELLVVLGIIGLLAAIVLASISSSRRKANDSRVLQDMGQVKRVAELIYNTNQSYQSLCASGGLNSGETNYGNSLNQLKIDLDNQNTTSYSPAACYSDVNNFCVSISNASGNIKCISHRGVVGNDTCVNAASPCD